MPGERQELRHLSHAEVRASRDACEIHGSSYPHCAQRRAVPRLTPCPGALAIILLWSPIKFSVLKCPQCFSRGTLSALSLTNELLFGVCCPARHCCVSSAASRFKRRIKIGTRIRIAIKIPNPRCSQNPRCRNTTMPHRIFRPPEISPWPRCTTKLFSRKH